MMTRSNFPKQMTPAMVRTRRPQGKALKGSTSGGYKAPAKRGAQSPRNIRRGC